MKNKNLKFAAAALVFLAAFFFSPKISYGFDGNIVDCYSSSAASSGSTYYDCGDCSKQTNSEGVGNPRTCDTSGGIIIAQ